MLCPVCNGDMYDNTKNKKNPKGPDYKCKDKECKWELDRNTGEYVPSEYGTAVWLPKGTKIVTKTPPAHESASNGKDSKDKTMCMSYAKDLIVAQIQASGGMPTPLKSIIFTYRSMLKEVENPGSVTFKEENQE